MGFCKNGHELTSENIYKYPKGKKFGCKKCNRDAHERYANSEKGQLACRRKELKRRGWTPEMSDAVYLAQDGKCAICKTVLAVPYHDHDHTTERPRGILCIACNSGLGQFRDRIDSLERAIEYLRKYRT